MSLTLTKILDSIKQPAQKVYTGYLKTLFIDNPAAIHLWTYGARDIPGVAPGHNHGEDGGEVLRGSIQSLALGPFLHEGTSGANFLEGIPLTRGSYSTSPKLLYNSLVTIPGGVTRLRGALLMKSGSPFGVTTVSVVLRPTNRHNFKLVANNLGVFATTDLVLTGTGEVYYLLQFAFSAADLSKVKNLSTTARAEFCVYQKGGNFAALGCFILGHDLWMDDDPTVSVRSSTTGDPPLSQITYSDILTGKILLTTLSRKLRGRLNAAIHGVLGRAPALGADAVAVQTDERWSRKVKTAHSHRGKFTPDGRGGFISDGACLRYPSRAAFASARFWGEDLSSLRNAADTQCQGKKIHSSGALDDTWLSWDFDIDLEGGLGALTMQVAIEPGNSTDNSRLLIHLGIFDSAETENLVKAVQCDFHQQESVDPVGLLVCELEPEENDAWVPNADRRIVAKSVYSQNAKKTPATASTLVQTVNAYRISKSAIAFVSHPLFIPNSSARLTGRYILRVRFSLPSGTAYDANARILAFEASAAGSY